MSVVGLGGGDRYMHRGVIFDQCRIKLCKVNGTLRSVFTSCGAEDLNWLYTIWNHGLISVK